MTDTPSFDIAGTGGLQIEGDAGTYAPASLPSPAPVPRRVTKRKRDHRLKRFRRELLKVAPDLNDSKYTPLLNSFGRLTILSIDAYEVLRSGGLLDDENREIRSSVETFARLAAQQLRFARELGLTPTALGKLKREKAADLVAAFEEHDAEFE